VYAAGEALLLLYALRVQHKKCRRIMDQNDLQYAPVSNAADVQNDTHLALRAAWWITSIAA